MTTGKRGTVQATVVSKGAGGKIDFTILAIDPKFPVHIYKVPEELARQLQLGQNYSLVLEQGSLRRDKDGGYPNHYFYNIISIEGATTTEETYPPTPQAVKSTPPPFIADTQAARECATNRRTALMQAVAYGDPTRDVLEIATDFDAWLNHEDAPSDAGSLPHTNPEPSPDIQDRDGELPF